MVYDIVFEPKEILHKKSKELSDQKINSKKTKQFIKDMVKTMYAKDGVGLAAVQVGQLQQLCTIVKQYNSINKKEDLCLVNPRWTKINKHQEWGEEGCLSVPGVFGKIKRYTKIKVRALDKNGEKLEFIAEGFFAKIIQHEVDHLNGRLYIEKAKDLHKVN
jgi:peptide deformylase